jgi:hypothetical protein
MTPFLKRMLAHDCRTVGVDYEKLYKDGYNPRETHIILVTNNKEAPPNILSVDFDCILLRVGLNWLKQNLTQKEWVSYIAHRLKGEVSP